MVARTYTVAFEGVEARIVEVQCAVAPGMPAFSVVGLPDKAVSEARDRVRRIAFNARRSMHEPDIAGKRAAAGAEARGDQQRLAVPLERPREPDAFGAQDAARLRAFGWRTRRREPQLGAWRRALEEPSAQRLVAVQRRGVERLEAHQLFEREGADVHCRVPISMVQATLGGSIEARTSPLPNVKITPSEHFVADIEEVLGKGAITLVT